MSKPREWWIAGDTVLVEPPWPEWPKDDEFWAWKHVIEKSAYDDARQALILACEDFKSLKAQADKLAEALEFNMREWTIVVDGYKNFTAWQKCRDALADYSLKSKGEK